ncbi:hypothetical protein M0802_004567 [Mischocyttarus mexicanus]|nr:hypothetical protein M0802_004567 [Mischocyttarus mexicanus]
MENENPLSHEFILGLVLKYLNAKELYNARLVCSSWNKIAGKENRLRGPNCCLIQKTNIFLTSDWKYEIENLLSNNRIFSAYTIFFTNGRFPKNRKKEKFGCRCLCNKGLTLLLENCSPSIVVYNLTGLFFPKDSDVFWFPISFKKLRLNDIYCSELVKIFSIDFHDADLLKEEIEMYFFEEHTNKGFIMLLCRESYFTIAKNLSIAMKTWYPNCDAQIWGGKVKGITYSNSITHKHICAVSVDCITIFIRGSEAKAWTLVLDKYPYTNDKIKSELEAFKRTISIKTYSVGFLFNKTITLVFESKFLIFQEVFTNIPMFEICGPEAFGPTLNEFINFDCNIRPRMVFTLLTFENFTSLYEYFLTVIKDFDDE